MDEGGGSGARSALGWVRQRVTQVARTPATALVFVVAPVVFAGAVAGAPAPAPVIRPPTQDADVMPLAAVAPNPGDISGPSVIEVSRPPSNFHVASASLSAPPPAVVVNSPGALGIPSMALSAYRNAEKMMSLAQPGCGVSWNLLAGIGRIESLHANNGATDVRGTAVRPIYGPTLDGSLPGNEIIVQSMANGRPTYARAMGPMQFLPGTWARYASDGDGDGKADPQNLFDSALAAGRYLCSGGLNLRDQSQVLSAILRYNNSMPYARNVLGWAAAYATGVVPVDLPPITGPVPPMGDAHLESGPEGLGPGLPINVLGLPTTDPMSQMQLVNFGSTDVANQMPSFFPPAMTPNQPGIPAPGCPTLVCFGANAMPSVTPPTATPFGPPLPGMGPSVMPGPSVGAPLPGPAAMPAAPGMPAAPPAPGVPVAPAAPPTPEAPQPWLPWLAPPPAPEPAPAPAPPPAAGPLPGPAA